MTINDYKICYKIQQKNDYTIGGVAAGTMREFMECIENQEASTHYMYLNGTEWNIVIHGYVLHEFYLKNSDDGICGELELHSRFTDMATLERPEYENIEDENVLKCKRVEIDTLGVVTKEDNDIFFTTSGGNTTVKIKLETK